MLDLFLIYQFIRRLVTPFKEWDAYKLGIIDNKGNVIRKRRELRTAEEKRAFGLYDILLLNVKKLLSKLPGGESRLASYTAALFLIREGVIQKDNMLSESVKEDLDVDNIMERLELFLNESLKKPFPLTITSFNNYFAGSAKFKVDNKTHELKFYANYIGDEKTWNVTWMLNNRTVKVIDDKLPVFEIYSTLVEFMRLFIKSAEPDKIEFLASKDSETSGRNSKQNLYMALADKMAKKLGYSISNSGPFIKLMKEDAPTVNVGSGNIAGLGVGPQGEPGLTPTQIKKYKDGNKSQILKRKKYSDLVELFDNPTKFTVKTSRSDLYHLISTVDGKKLEFVADKTHVSSNTWVVFFEYDGTIFQPEEANKNTFKVFSTVISMFDSLIKEKNPIEIEFSADKIEKGVIGSRSKLYYSMVKKFANKNGYEFKTYESKYDTTFLLKRKK
jgi:hypothetical protein